MAGPVYCIGSPIGGSVKIHKRIKVNSWLVALLAAGALALITPLVFTLRYASNDDVGMRLIAEGRFVPDGKPLPFLLYINTLLGYPLAWAYTLVPNAPWYDLLMGATIVLSAAALFFTWGAANTSRQPWSFLFGLFFLLPIFVSQQFTQTGMISAAAGTILIARAAFEPDSKGVRRTQLWFGCALFVWGGLIRIDGAALIAITAAGFALPFVFASRKDRAARPRLLSATGFAVAGAILLTLCFAFNLASYARDPGWREFQEYNWVRAELTEFLPGQVQADDVSGLQNRTGWSANDFSMLRQWFFTDPELFNLGKLRQAVAVLHSGRGPRGTSVKFRLRQAVESVLRFAAQNKRAFLIIAAFTFVQGGRGRKAYLFLLWSTSVLLLTVLVVGITLKELPYRVSWPLLILQTGFLTLATVRWGQVSRSRLTFAAFVCAAALGANALGLQLGYGSSMQGQFAAASEDVNELVNRHKDLYVIHAGNFPYESIWRPFHQEERRFSFLPLGTAQQTPPTQDFLRKTGRLNLPLSICSEPGIVLVTTSSFLPVISEFVLEHGGRQVEFELALTTNTFRGWRCHDRVGTAGESPRALNP